MEHGLAAGLGLLAVVALAQLLSSTAPQLLRPRHQPADRQLVGEAGTDTEGEAAWWLEQGERKDRVAETCARLGTGRPATKDDVVYARAHRLLYCMNAKVTRCAITHPLPGGDQHLDVAFSLPGKPDQSPEDAGVPPSTGGE